MNDKQSDVDSAMVLFLVTLAFLFAFMSGACDNRRKWTASDMRGEVQERLDRLEAQEQRETEPWKQLRIQAERDELLAITEPYE